MAYADQDGMGTNRLVSVVIVLLLHAFLGYALVTGLAYDAVIADLVVISSLIIDVTVRDVKKVSADQAVGVPTTLQRVLVNADVMALIRGDGGTTPRVRFVLDMQKDTKGKIPKLKKLRMFLFGRQVVNRPGEIQLSRPNALASFSLNNDALVRDITKEAVQLNAPRRIMSIANAFHSVGTMLGEGETQIFLKTDTDQPLTLTVLSRPVLQSRYLPLRFGLREDHGATRMRGDTIIT